MTTTTALRTIDEAAKAWKKSRATIFKWKKQNRIRTAWRERAGKSVLVVLDEHPPKPAPRGSLKPEQRRPWGNGSGTVARVHRLPFPVTVELLKEAKLNSKEALVARKRFVDAKPWTLTRIAARWKVTRQAVFEIEKTVRTKLHSAQLARRRVGAQA